MCTVVHHIKEDTSTRGCSLGGFAVLLVVCFWNTIRCKQVVSDHLVLSTSRTILRDKSKSKTVWYLCTLLYFQMDWVTETCLSDGQKLRACLCPIPLIVLLLLSVCSPVSATAHSLNLHASCVYKKWPAAVKIASNVNFTVRPPIPNGHVRYRFSLLQPNFFRSNVTPADVDCTHYALLNCLYLHQYQYEYRNCNGLIRPVLL